MKSVNLVIKEMSKKKENSPRKWVLTNFFAVAAVAITVANLWLATKLMPLTLSVSKLSGQVLANEGHINDFQIDLVYIRGRVDALYNFFIK